MFPILSGYKLCNMHRPAAKLWKMEELIEEHLCSVPAFLLQLILQLHLAVKLLLQLVDPFLQVLQLSRK